MRKSLVETYINQLRASFGPVKVPAKEEELRVLYDGKDYAGMIRHVRGILHLDMKVRLGLVNSGGPNAPAWIEGPGIMPLYGTSAFRQTMVVIYLRKSFLQDGSFEETILAVAHELSHVVLDAVRHPLREQEEAVDLTAMLLGFRDFYVTGCESVRKKKQSWMDILRGKEERYEVKRSGYLTAQEVRYAAAYMTFH